MKGQGFLKRQGLVHSLGAILLLRVVIATETSARDWVQRRRAWRLQKIHHLSVFKIKKNFPQKSSQNLLLGLISQSPATCSFL
ncbi:rCG43547 [Rattus norvegicus]|uniref:RCG43547 n=1 Tax=Rattus norvegicus TaxID=10116 RepID=A6JIW7_RAT|nr:rCG43547 [Rattus norvegicus]